MKVEQLIKRLSIFDKNKEVLVRGCYASEGYIDDITSNDKEVLLISDICSG